MNSKDARYWIAFALGALVVGSILHLIFHLSGVVLGIGAIAGGWVAGFVSDQAMSTKNRRGPGDDDDLR